MTKDRAPVPAGTDEAKVRTDCRHFRADRPCAPHKRDGVLCPGCTCYEPVKTRVLVVKLDAMGDVLRTTCVLEPLARAHGRPHVTWVTRPESAPMLANNPYVDRVLALGPDALAHLAVEEFDLVLNPDASPASGALAGMAWAPRRLGFALDRRGCVYCCNPEARAWFLMGLDDGLKRANRRTYQDIVLEMLRLPPEGQRIIVALTEEERAYAHKFSQGHQLGDAEVVGLNTGAGGRWPRKAWSADHCGALIRALLRETDATVLLYGGPAEADRNAALKRKARSKRVIDAGAGHPVREFMALVDVCDVLVTGDTLALHIGVALNKYVIALFGPTSSAEIDLYGRGKKIVAPLDCTCCYNPACERDPDCMDSIAPEVVLEAVLAGLAAAG